MCATKTWYYLLVTYRDAGSDSDDNQAHGVGIDVENAAHTAHQGYHDKTEQRNPHHRHYETKNEQFPAKVQKHTFISLYTLI